MISFGDLFRQVREEKSDLLGRCRDRKNKFLIINECWINYFTSGDGRNYDANIVKRRKKKVGIMTGAGFLRDLSPQIEMFVRPWLADLVSHQNFTSRFGHSAQTT